MADVVGDRPAAWVAGMKSTALTAEQLDKLLHDNACSREYTFRLVQRMNTLGFPDADALSRVIWN
jgi:hypothetical protein